MENWTYPRDVLLAIELTYLSIYLLDNPKNFKTHRRNQLGNKWQICVDLNLVQQ